ncbi:Gfo/Idh/MocA family oxidoreductase [Paenibacillus sp. P26]|nr:Gfo/Idh/MocA family oxidoreductase [Paenibacillus sp. P26]
MGRVAVVGVGGIAVKHLQNFQENERSELVAVCDIVQAQAEKAASLYGVNPYTDFDAMLEKERPDALAICVPPFAHGDMEEKAAARGIHLLVEKPLGLDMAVVRAKAEAIRTSGIIAGTGYCLRYLDTAAKAKAYLQGKKVAMVRAHRFGSLVETPWWRDMSQSGGQLVEQTTHNMDLIRYLAGGVRKVSADMALRVMDDIPGISIPDVCSVNLLFESGAVGHLDTSFVEQTGWPLQPGDHRPRLPLNARRDGTHHYGKAADRHLPKCGRFLQSAGRCLYRCDCYGRPRPDSGAI